MTRFANRRGFKIVLAHLVISLMAVMVVAPAASAITYYLPDKTLQGDYTYLVIGRLGDNQGSGNTLPIPSTSAKLIYNRVPDSVSIFDGAYCKDSPVDNHNKGIACNADPNQDTNFVFQAINNETGAALGAAITVKGSTMSAASPPSGTDTYKVNLAGLQGAAPSTDGKYFVEMTVSWVYQNPPSCTSTSKAPTCQSGTNAFMAIMPQSTDLITYPATDVGTSALGVLAPQPANDQYSDISFEFAPKCNASGSALSQKLIWEDADYKEPNQDFDNMYWELIDDSAPGGPQQIDKVSGSALGGNGTHKEKSEPFQMNHKYRWIWHTVDKNNGLNVFLPFDGYDYTRTCPVTPPPPGPPPPSPPPTQTQPYFRVTGGDVSVGQGMSLGGVNCAMAKNPNAGIASWNQGATGGYAGAGTQYAAFVLKHLQEFSTAQGGTIRPSGLAFANDSTAGISASGGLYGGNYGGNSCVNDYFADATSIQSGSKALSDLPGFPAGGAIANGSKLTYYIDGDLYIDSDVRFSGSYPTVSDIPSFKVVVRGNIYIDKGVSQLDGIYIAEPTGPTATNGNLYTCMLDSTPPYTAPTLDSQLSVNCDTALTINGAISARQLWLLRTGGDVKSTPAETVNYLPELWVGTKPAITIGNGDNYDAITGLPPVL